MGCYGEGEAKLWLSGFAAGAIALVSLEPGVRVVCCVCLLKGMVHQSPHVF